MVSPLTTGRVNQKERTRTAILDAARRLVPSGREITMPLIAAEARVSEATAYRYFPDLASLLSEAIAHRWPSASEAMQAVSHVDDPVVRVAHAVRTMLEDVRDQQGAVRVMMSAAVVRPQGPALRPGRRFALIDEALRPLTGRRLTAARRRRIEQLKRDLAIVVSAEAFFNLIDLCGLSPDEAIASVMSTASTLTRAAVRDLG